MRAGDSNVLKFIGGLDKTFAIPPFQRNYEWTREQCDELYNDIISSHNTGKNHYIGNIVYYIGGKSGASFSEYILIDGQQRVTTILLLLCAIRDYIKDDEELKINARYLINDTRDDKFRIKLKQTSFDSKVFSKIIDSEEIGEEEKNCNVYKNYSRFLERINDTVNDETSVITAIDVYNAIQKLDIVDVNLDIKDDLSYVQTIFEKINSTGKQLEPSDLIRNFLLLANSIDEQQELYDRHWVKLEEKVGSNNVTRFSKDYLILKTFDDVPADKVYSIFKNHFIDSNMEHIDILDDMVKYADYYSWLLNSNCKDGDKIEDEINGDIEFLNLLKTDDLYPLYILLFEKLFRNNKDELKKILNLLCDFMLRYRIVSPSGGGGALRTVIHTLLDKITNNIIEPTYETIIFELSNSSTPANRFPDNEEFKETLKNAVNTSYARALLYKMEKVETKNIPVSLSKVTVEHLMPQTLSNQWKLYLGGKNEDGTINEKKANDIYNTYINCIGNLAPISGPYNSSNSNNPWNLKLELLKKIQFTITSEIPSNSEYHEWKEENIKERNENIATRACNDIIAPLNRTREYESRVATTEFEPGVYELSDLTTPMSGQTPTTIIYGDRKVEIQGWYEFLPKLCEILYSEDSKKMEELILQNKIHKSTSKHINGIKDPIISKNKELIISPMNITNTNIYVESCLSSGRARYYAKQILDVYELTDKFQLYVY